MTDWVWFGIDENGKHHTSLGRWRKHPCERRYKLAAIQPTEWDHDDPRDEVARVVEQVAEEGLTHPRNLDAALDVIFEAVKSKHRDDCESVVSALVELLKALDDQDEERTAWAMQLARNALGDL